MEPIALLPHNQKTFDTIKKMIANGDKRIGIVQPTGTGKSYLVAKLVEHYPNKKRLILSPSVHINEQLKNLCEGISQDTDYMTYTKLTTLTYDMLYAMQYDIIVLDEYHRVGAEVWGDSVTLLLEHNPEALLIGLSATPIRYLDKQKDMSQVLFENNLAVNMTLVEAMAQGILPLPYYISALYTFDQVADGLIRQIHAGRNTEREKADFIKQVIAAKRHLEQSRGIPDILKKHFELDHAKTIVFCKDITHLKEMQTLVVEWFKTAYSDVTVNTYTLLSQFGSTTNARVLEAFNNANEGVNLLFTIDMLNEGIHIRSVSNVILLRPTESLIIYYQQLGRALVAGGSVQPKIFDFVNNMGSITGGVFEHDLRNAFEQLSGELLPNHVPSFHIYDEILIVEQLFADIERKIVSAWSIYYLALENYYKTYGDTAVPMSYRTPEGLRLGSWIYHQKCNYQKGTLTPEQLEKLCSVNFDYTIITKDEAWERMYDNLVQFYKENRHFYVQRIGKCVSLAQWIRRQREYLHKGTLPAKRLKRLKTLGLEPTFEESRGGYYLKMYQDAIRDGVEITQSNPYYKGVQLNFWVTKVRQLKATGGLDPKTEKALDKLNFVWVLADRQWLSNYQAACEWLETHDIADLVYRTEHKGVKIGVWVTRMNNAYRKGELPPDRVGKLRSKGFIHDKQHNILWDKMYALYVAYKTQTHDLSEAQLKQLLQWEKRQRVEKRKNTLPKDRMERLERMQIDWEPASHVLTWEQSYAKMKAYREAHGNCDVPELYDGFTIKRWVNNQRNARITNTLSAERIMLLDGIDFIWDQRGYDWLENYEKLKQYYIENGHTEVASITVYGGVNLGSWVRTQRKRRRSGVMSQKEERLLNLLDFKWEVRKSS